MRNMQNEKVWFITGSSRGFGKIWTEAALKRGDKVAATARNINSIAVLKENYGDNVLTLEVDVTNANQVQSATNEALHLSAKEKETILSLFRNIEMELENRIDDMSHDVIIAQIELLLNYAQRFYKRQFITRKQKYHSLTDQIDAVLENYFRDEQAIHNGVPTVNYVWDQLHISASYLSDLLRNLTGQNTQQFIHDKMIYRAKNKLATTSLSISEIAFELGFEQPQSFSRLFKSKTQQSPQEYRAQFN